MYRKIYKMARKYSKKMRSSRAKARKLVDKLQNRRIAAIERQLKQNGGQLDYEIGNGRSFPCVRPVEYNPGVTDYTTTFALSLNNMIQQGPFENCRTDQTITLKNMVLRLLLQYDLSASTLPDPLEQPNVAKVNILIVRYHSKVLRNESATSDAPSQFAPISGSTWDGYDLSLSEICTSCRDENGNVVRYNFDSSVAEMGVDRFSYPMFNTQSKLKYDILYNKCHFISSSKYNDTPTTTTNQQGYPTQHGATDEKIININLKSKVNGKRVYYNKQQPVEKLDADPPLAANLLDTQGVPEIEPQGISRGEIVLYAWSDVKGYGATPGVIVPQLSGHMRVKWV